jgi:hypothetical protein
MLLSPLAFLARPPPVGVFISLLWIPQTHPSATPGWPTRAAKSVRPLTLVRPTSLESAPRPVQSKRANPAAASPQSAPLSRPRLRCRYALHTESPGSSSPVCAVTRSPPLELRNVPIRDRLALLGPQYQKPRQNPSRMAHGNLRRRPQRTNRQRGSTNQSKRQDARQEPSHKFLRSHGMGPVEAPIAAPGTISWHDIVRRSRDRSPQMFFPFAREGGEPARGNFRGSQAAKSCLRSPCAATLPRRRHGRPSERTDPRARSPIRSIR